MVPNADNEAEIVLRVEAVAPDVNPPPSPAPTKRGSARTCYRLEGGRLVACDPAKAVVIVYSEPTIDDESEMQELYNIDFHTLQSSLDPDELARLEFETDHAAIIFKRPRSFCADDNFLLKLTSTGVFIYEDHVVIVMPDEAPVTTTTRSRNSIGRPVSQAEGRVGKEKPHGRAAARRRRPASWRGRCG